MSNPVVTVTSTITPPAASGDPRISWLQVIYSNQDFFVYGVNEKGSFSPVGHGGERFYAFSPLGVAFAGDVGLGVAALLKATVLQFVANQAWDTEEAAEVDKRGLFWQPSGFVNAVNSVMPKLIMPSTMLIENGSADNAQHGISRCRALVSTGPNVYKDAFTWAATLNGVPLSGAELGRVSASQQSPFVVSFQAKDDTQAENILVATLDEPADPPTGNWSPAALVGQGAFCILVGVEPHNLSQQDPANVAQKSWNVKIDAGDISLFLQEGGALTAMVFGGDSDGNTGTINLPDARAKEGPPHLAHFKEGTSVYAIIVYPVWNGIVVTSGIQDVRPSVESASLYVQKRKNVYILDAVYATAFDPDVPNEVEVGVGVAPVSDVLVDFGSQVVVTGRNCNLQLAYLPCFFSPRMWMDEWILASEDDPGTVTYDYDTWPIWTANGTSYDFNPAYGMTDPGMPGPTLDTKYLMAPWYMDQIVPPGSPVPSRFGPQIFGSMLRVEEDMVAPVAHGNGSFNITVDALPVGIPGDPTPDASWHKYITTIQVSINEGGTSGTLTVDKYGWAGQEAVASQAAAVGALRFNLTGGYGINVAVPGGVRANTTEFFAGLGFGIGDSKGQDGASWTVPLVGLERKLDDIALVNAPFVDGWDFGDILDFLLLRYAGIDYVIESAGLATTPVRVSENIQAPVFNWQAGTTVRAALDEICADVQARYYVQGQYIRFYALDANGYPAPSSAPPDWEPEYPDVKVTTVRRDPVLDNLRNEVIVIGMEQVTAAKGTKLDDLPLFPRIYAESQATTPSIAWARRLVHVAQGALDETSLQDIADKLLKSAKTYDVTGSVAIPGNANIRLYDKWGDFFIMGITHNVDLQAKTFTTDLEFMGGT